MTNDPDMVLYFAVCHVNLIDFEQANSKNFGPPPGNKCPWSRSNVKVTAWYQ